MHVAYFDACLFNKIDYFCRCRKAFPIYRKDVMNMIDTDPGRWCKLPIALVDDGVQWDLHLDKQCVMLDVFADVDEEGKHRASLFISIIRDLIVNSGGAIPLIVNNTLGENWKQELNQAAEHPLDKKSLENIAEVLKNVPIFLTGDANLVGATADVDAKLFWTLTSDQFQHRFVTVPDLTRAARVVPGCWFISAA